MDQHGVRRIVFTSTVALYGLDKTNPPKETDQVDPFNDYGRSKWEAECVLREWVVKGDGRSGLILRPSVIFGEGNRGNVYNLLKQIHSGNFRMIGDGRNQKSMAYIGNVVAFIRFMLEKKWERLEVFNYLDTPDFDMNSLVSEVYRFKGEVAPKIRIPYGVGIMASLFFDLAAKVTGRKFPISSIRIKKFCANTLIDGTKLNATGFIRPFSLVDGLQKMLKAEFQPSGGRYYA
jgi:GlcNAc-P-P-Und epimerase